MPITPGRAGGGSSSQLKGEIRQLAECGAEGVLLREPQLDDAAFLELALFTRQQFPLGWVGVHDRPHVAIASGADAVHLGFRSIAPSLVRGVVPQEMCIGHSQHGQDVDLKEMVSDYRFMGPVYYTASKSGLLDPLGLPAFQGMPMLERTWAVGGVSPERAREVLGTGVGGIACIGGLFGEGGITYGMSSLLAAAESI